MNLTLQELQRRTEHMYSKKNINDVVLLDLQSEPDVLTKIEQAVELITEWMHQDHYREKNARLIQLHERDITEIVEQMLVVCTLVHGPVLFTQVVGEVTGALKMSNKIEGTKTAAEIMTFLAEVDLIDIFKQDKYSPLFVCPVYGLEDETVRFIERTKYLPPMVCEPNEVTKNFDGAYLTEKSSMILGKGNHHDGDICLDSINKFNQVPLSLNQTLLTTLSETPKREFNDPEHREQWTKFVKDSYATYKDLIQVGNKFWLTHKTDKRGRTYSQGYHVNTQGNQFRKAIIEFTEKEVIT